MAPAPAAAGGWQTAPGGAQVAGTRRGPSGTDIVFGLIFLVVGLWLFAEITLGLDVPSVRWGDLWPLILILLGGWVLVGAVRRR